MGLRAERQGVLAGVLLLAPVLAFAVTYTIDPKVFGLVRNEFHSWLPNHLRHTNQAPEAPNRANSILPQESAKP